MSVARLALQQTSPMNSRRAQVTDLTWPVGHVQPVARFRSCRTGFAPSPAVASSAVAVTAVGVIGALGLAGDHDRDGLGRRDVVARLALLVGVVGTFAMPWFVP